MGNYISNIIAEQEQNSNENENENHLDDDHLNDDDEHFENVESYIEYFYKKYPEKHIYKFPEYAVNKLDLNESYLEGLPEENERTRKTIRDWMTKSEISLNNFIWVGW